MIDSLLLLFCSLLCSVLFFLLFFFTFDTGTSQVAIEVEREEDEGGMVGETFTDYVSLSLKTSEVDILFCPFLSYSLVSSSLFYE